MRPLVVLLLAIAPFVSGPSPEARRADSGGERAALQSDLDQFMQRVLGHRDENWKKLQQYVLDERERVEVLAPGRVRLFGLARDYTWFIKEGYFVRSPVRFDGVTVSEEDRRAAERRWIERERKREAKRGPQGPGASESTPTPAEIGDVLRQEPQFVSAAYFLRFRFEPGHYALVGRESLDGRDVLRIEYYPSNLFRDDDERKEKTTVSIGSSEGVISSAPADDEPSRDDRRDERFTQQMNKVALVSLWIDPATQQIVQYTFDNVGFDFLPGRWLVRVDDVHATMRMREAFPGVWLPRGIDGAVAMTLAKGSYEARFEVTYENYRLADVKVQVR